MSDNFDGLDPKQARLLRSMIGSMIRAKCLCHITTGDCLRCRRVKEIREHFPQNWTYAADIHAQTGDSQ